jgi:hypothetical protein
MELLCTISITLIIDNTRFIFDNRVVLLYKKVSFGGENLTLPPFFQ